MQTLGINAAFHDSAAVLVRDGVVLAAAEEERFTHVKHGKRPVPFSVWELPFNAIDYCLREAGVPLASIDHVAYSFDPAMMSCSGTSPTPLFEEPSGNGERPWDRLFLCYVLNAPAQLVDGPPHHLAERFRNAKQTFRWHYVEHHLAHEASAFLAAPFEDCAVLTMDGRGERSSTSYGLFSGGQYARIGQVDLPHSLGLLYEEVTDYLGFLRSSDEYKVMALASYGKPKYLGAFREILRPGANGRYEVAALELSERFGPPRARGAPLEQRHFDVAHSLQRALEDTALELVHWLHRETHAENLAMAGGVALNCVMNARIRDRGPFRGVWVQPAAGDAGTALGAALWTDLRERGGARRWHMEHAYLGPAFMDDEIQRFLDWSNVRYRKAGDVAEEAADMLAADRIIGWFQGRMEFGPRALGARSILASPIDAGMQARLNEIKDREDFRPVAPVVMEEHAAEWFVRGSEAPFMLFVFDVCPGKEELIPAVRHTDGTARVQTVRRSQHPLYYDLLDAFYRRTGVPVLVNTSFNTRGEPIVCTPRDAMECFWTSPLDAIVIGSFIVEKDAGRS